MNKKNHNIQRVKAINSSIWVAVCTTITFFGFFIRDLLMAKIYGFGTTLDQFYLVTMLPMFMVTIFCIPFGQAVIPRLKTILNHSQDKFLVAIKHFSFLAFASCIFIGLFNFFISNTTFHLMSQAGWIVINKDVNLMQLTVLPILFLSGLIVLSNSILTVKEHYIFPSIAQMIVPVIAILFLILLGKLIGVIIVIVAMVVGQIINFMFVYFALKKENVRLFPFEFDFKTPFNFWKAYAHLVLIAFFTTSLVLINTYISTTLGPGAASIFNLGTKFSLFLMGIFTAIFTSVLLPYLSKVSLYEDKHMLKKETHILVLSSAIIFIPFSLTIYQCAEWISQQIFSGIVSEPSTVLGISSVIKYSVIQLPFWIFNSIIFRHANAINKFSIITISSVFILLLNLLFALSLIKNMNIGGLALSMMLSSAATSGLLLIYYIHKKHIDLTQAAFLMLSWIFFGLILFGLNFERLLRFI